MNDIFYIKPVDNSRISKPVDLRLSAQLVSWLVVATILAMALLFKAWESVQIRQLGYRIEAVRSETDGLQQENHLLLVERAALRSPQRIDNIARDMLGMTLPSPQQVIMLDATHTGSDQVMAQVRSADAPMAAKRRTTE